MHETLRDAITRVGNTYSGHVTNGSVDEIMQVVRTHVAQMAREVYKEWEIDAWNDPLADRAISQIVVGLEKME